MTRAQEIRDEVLLQLAAAFPEPVPVHRLHRQAKRGGFDYTERELATGAAYLAGLTPPLAEEVIDPATNATRWKATSAGVAHHERFGN